MKFSWNTGLHKARIVHPFGVDIITRMLGLSGKKWFFGLMTVKEETP